jgi:iron(III) transport system substrate-binding protein
MERQEAALTIWNHQDIMAQAAEGAAFDIHMPASGAPINLDGIAKVAGGPNPEAAEAFADYIFSDETQTWLAENAFQIPTMEIEAEPEWLENIEIVEFPVDRAVIGANEQEWIDYWLENIKNQG